MSDFLAILDVYKHKKVLISVNKYIETTVKCFVLVYLEGVGRETVKKGATRLLGPPVPGRLGDGRLFGILRNFHEDGRTNTALYNTY